MKISKSWATPLTIGSFFIMSVTGILMFFNMEMGANKLAHQWLGWLMVIAVFAHIICHFTSFQRYFSSSIKGIIIILVCILILTISFFAPAKVSKKTSPPALVMQTFLNMPLGKLGVVLDKSPEEIINELKNNGVIMQSNINSLNDISKDDRKIITQIVNILLNNKSIDN